MKYRLVVLSIVIVLLFGGCNLPGQQPDTTSTSASLQTQSLDVLKKSSTSNPSISFQNGFPLSVMVNVPTQGTTPVERAKYFLSTYQDLYNISNPDLGLEVLRYGNRNGLDYVTFYQTYQGIPVYGSNLVVNLNGQNVLLTSGKLLQNDLDIDIVPTLSRQEAENVARSAFGLLEAPVLGETNLMIYDTSVMIDTPSNPHLVWRVRLQSAPSEAYVDAHNGEIVHYYSLSEDGYDLDLNDAEGEANAKDDSCYNSSWDPELDEDDIGEGDTDADGAWQFSRDAYNFYNSRGWDSWDGDGATIEIFIRANVNNATWRISCELIEFGTNWVAKDIMLHEFTHAVISAAGPLDYNRDSGALNESFADIMAAWETNDWNIGESIGGSSGLPRDMSLPADNLSIPATATGVVCDKDINDNCGVHTRSAVHNYVAYILVNGGSNNGWTVSGIGMNKGAGLMYAVMFNPLPSNAQFINARDTAVAIATQWAASGANGFTKQDVCEVRNAYAAALIGSGDTNCDEVDDSTDTDDDGDFYPDTEDNCPIIVNYTQKDTDKDGVGDDCDPDVDGDTLTNSSDNCPVVSNTNQADGDANGVGDACQDTDADKIIDIADNCPNVKNKDQKDTEGDGTGDVCDDDDDNDGVPDSTDNADLVSNPGQEDGDNDNVGDVIDNCIAISNEDQSDVDDDGVGDACDPDADNDNVVNEKDNCPLDSNPEQVDLDKNGAGYKCDPREQEKVKELEEKFILVSIVKPGDANIFIESLPLCAGGCPFNWGLDTFTVSISTSDFPERTRPFISDDTGSIVAWPSVNGDFSFHPIGGRNYFFNLAFEEGYEGGSDLVVELTVQMGEAPPKEETSSTEVVSTETPTLVPSVTPVSRPTFTLTKNAFCRKGPDASFEDVSAILAGETVDILNTSEDGFWYFVDWKSFNVKCWVAASAGNVNGDLSGIEVLIVPLPTEAQIEPLPTPLACNLSCPAGCEVNSDCSACQGIGGGACKP